MYNRRQFLRTTSIGTMAMAFSMSNPVFSMPWNTQNTDFTTLRPALDKRGFSSKAIEEVIAQVKKDISDPEIAWLFENCFPNTLDTTVIYTEIDGKPDTFVFTGDIRAMWLRDSSAQVWPYIPFIKKDASLQKLIAGVINRQVKCILLDPYANAFMYENEISQWKTDITEMKPGIHERKWEVDSLCYPIRLAYNYWKTSGDTSIFSADWIQAMELVLKTFTEQQRKENEGPYSFKRITAWQTDTVPGNGMGNPIRPNGLICSVFRPSDDATTFLYLIPSNYFAAVSLHQLSEILTALGKQIISLKAKELATEIDAALNEHALTVHSKYGTIYSYETDGYGNYLMMDDSNVPSLLSLPYLGCVDREDVFYKNTRNFLLSEDNPWYFKGKAAQGIGSPHTLKDKIWPMTIIMQAMTSTDKEEIAQCIHLLKTTHADTGFMHESFNKDNPKDFTRSWFAWANTLFGELILKIHHEYPELLSNN